MKMNRVIGKRWGILAGLFLSFAALAPAKDGRDFAGFYELTDVSELGDDYQLTFTARVFNYSDADVNNASLFLQDASEPGKTYATFTGVYMHDRENVRLSSLVTVPRREYKSWLQGRSPALEIQFTDPSGKTVRRRVELMQMPVGEEQ